jgi:cell division septation protein DedD
MTEQVEQNTGHRWWQNLSEEKLLSLLLLGLGLILLLILLLWKALDDDAENTVVPVAESKSSVWFDENGPRLSADGAARLQQEQAASIATTDKAEGLVVETVEIKPSATTPTSKEPTYWVLLGTFSQMENADSLAKKVSSSASQVEVAPLQRQSGRLYAVRVPAFKDHVNAENLADQLAKAYGLKPLVVKASK